MNGKRFCIGLETTVLYPYINLVKIIRLAMLFKILPWAVAVENMGWNICYFSPSLCELDGPCRHLPLPPYHPSSFFGDRVSNGRGSQCRQNVAAPSFARSLARSLLRRVVHSSSRESLPPDSVCVRLRVQPLLRCEAATFLVLSYSTEGHILCIRY